MTWALASTSLRGPASRELRWTKESLWWASSKPARMPSQRLGANSSGLAAPTHLSTSGRTAELAPRGASKTLLERSREPLMSIDD